MRKLVCFLTLALLFPAIAGAFPSWTAVGIGSHDVDWTPGGSGTLAVAGTFGGATVTFFWCAPLPGTPQCFEVDATACTFTVAGVCDFFKGPGTLRLTVAGGTPAINAVAAGPTQASAGGANGGVSGLLEGFITFGSPSGTLAQDSAFFYEANLNRVGIGTATPVSPLDIVSSPLASGTSAIEVDISGFSTGSIFALRASGLATSDLDIAVENEQGAARFNAFSSGAGDSFVLLRNPSQEWSFGLDQSDSNRFHITSAGNLGSDRRLTIDTVGNVGIGIANPTAKLHVEGRVVTQNGLGLYGRNSANTANLRIADLDGSDTVNFGPNASLQIQAGAPNLLLVVNSDGVAVGDGSRFELPESTTPPTGTEAASYWDPADDVFFIHDGTNYLALTPRLGGELDNITYVIDTAVAPNQDVHVSLFNSIGGVIDSVPHCYLTDDPGGIGKSADVPDAITPGANQFLTQIGADLRSFFLGADTLGLVDLTFNEASGPAGDSYRLACLVDGLKFVSGVIIPKP